MMNLEFLFHGLGEHYEYLGHGALHWTLGGIRENSTSTHSICICITTPSEVWFLSSFLEPFCMLP